MTTAVIAGKYVLGMKDGRQAVLQDHYVYVDGTRIEAVTRDAPAAGTEVIRYEHGLVTPGFINLHAHCIRGGLFRGIPDDLDIEPYVPTLVYRILLPLTALATKELSREELRAVTALGLIDLLKGGSTTVLDQWHHGQEVFFDVAKEIGMRVVGAPFIMSASNSRLGADGFPVWDFDNDGLAQLQKSIATFKARDEGREGLVQVAIGPHATDTCLPELLRECRKAADDLGAVLTTHFAQTPQELALLRSRYGMGPAEYAKAAGLLGRRRPEAACCHRHQRGQLRLQFHPRGREFSLCPIRRGGHQHRHRHRFARHGPAERDARQRHPLQASFPEGSGRHRPPARARGHALRR
jgi:5-methylthioadenosine/S-adenosylhomocysteine deaminase